VIAITALLNLTYKGMPEGITFASQNTLPSKVNPAKGKYG